MKAFLAPVIRKSVPKELIFAKIGFLNLADFTTDDRFLISLSIPPPLTPPALADTSWFLLFSITWVPKAFLLVIQSIKVNGVAILLKF